MEEDIKKSIATKRNKIFTVDREDQTTMAGKRVDSLLPAIVFVRLEITNSFEKIYHNSFLNQPVFQH